MTDINRLIDGYFAVWNETKAERRRDLIAKTWAENAAYLDPIMSGEGHDGIDRMIAGAQAQFPGHVFRQIGKADNHNDRLRFSWVLVGPDGNEIGVAGTDFGTVSNDGRLAAITGFLDQMPTA
ncbi:MAG: nuclear transport factor 2 family protein [Parvibaculum sp.]|uniref:nuclear transport factor 2 family protein n=1 Tax=Parvibaculum sp. TaxID=2024848 RepID=UPI003C729953